MWWERPWELVALRLVCLCFASTWFVPDEQFQSVEIAYRMVYGLGKCTWEWDPEWALRSVLHPALYGALFWTLRFVRLDFGCLVRWAPNALHAVLFALADWCYLRWAKRLGLSYAAYRLTMTLYIFNWFMLYCSTRTLANTLECCLSIIALNFYAAADDEPAGHEHNDDVVQRVYPKKGKTAVRMASSSRNSSSSSNWFGCCLFCVSLSTVLRPTTLLLWLPLILPRFWHMCFMQNGHLAFKSMFRLLPFCLAPLTFSVICDSLYYGKFVVCLWHFVRFNVFQGGSAHFGVHPWHWYLTQGLPPLLTVLMFPLLLSIAACFRHRLTLTLPSSLTRRYLMAALIYVAGHSLIAHKEHRFLLPILPFMFPALAQQLSSYKWQTVFKYAYIALNLALAVYFGIIHQRGPYAVNIRLLQMIDETTNGQNVKIVQLMPCFSLPHYAHLHPHGNRTTIRMLNCLPKLLSAGHHNDPTSTTTEDDDDDEADKLYADPEGWLNAHWYTLGFFDAHAVVAFEQIYVKIERFLMQKGFARHSAVFHAHWPSSRRQSPWIVIAKRKF